jgi:uncharacterized damage-inducible protein DinB
MRGRLVVLCAMSWGANIDGLLHSIMNRLETLVAEWERAKAGTRDYLESVSTDQLGFRPAHECRSFAEQFLHVASTQYAFAASATGQTNPLVAAGADPEKDEKLKVDLDAFRRFVLESYDFMINGVRALDPAVLDEEVAFFRLRMPRSLLLAKALEHHAHHRGQAAIYLRLSGITPPSERLF